MIQTYKNDKCRISLWLDKDLIKRFKDYRVDLNQELRQFFAQKKEYLYQDIEITFDSYPEVQKMINLLSEFDTETTRLLKYLDSFKDPLIDISIDVFYDHCDRDYNDDFDEDKDDSCDRLSTYFGAFHDRPQERYKDAGREPIIS